MEDGLVPRDRCTERLISVIDHDPWLARYAIAMCCLNMELGSLNELVRQVEAADEALVASDKRYFEKLVRERYGLG